jgi:pilus assembly protein Flp/PilA
MELVKRFVSEEQGQGLVEYALIAALIAVVCVAALQTLSGDISTKLTEVGDAIDAS